MGMGLLSPLLLPPPVSPPQPSPLNQSSLQSWKGPAITQPHLTEEETEADHEAS